MRQKSDLLALNRAQIYFNLCTSNCSADAVTGALLVVACSMHRKFKAFCARNNGDDDGE